MTDFVSLEDLDLRFNCLSGNMLKLYNYKLSNMYIYKTLDFQLGSSYKKDSNTLTTSNHD